MTVEIADKFNVTTAWVAVAIPAARSLPEAVDLAASAMLSSSFVILRRQPKDVHPPDQALYGA